MDPIIYRPLAIQQEPLDILAPRLFCQGPRLRFAGSGSGLMPIDYARRTLSTVIREKRAPLKFDAAVHECPSAPLSVDR